jgi:hypothetical protein
MFALGLAFVALAAAFIIDMEGLPDTGLNTSSWVTGQAPPLEDIFNLHDIQMAAKNTMSLRDYCEQGAAFDGSKLSVLGGVAFFRTGALDEISTPRFITMESKSLRLKLVQHITQILTCGKTSNFELVRLRMLQTSAQSESMCLSQELIEM